MSKNDEMARDILADFVEEMEEVVALVREGLRSDSPMQLLGTIQDLPSRVIDLREQLSLAVTTLRRKG